VRTVANKTKEVFAMAYRSIIQDLDIDDVLFDIEMIQFYEEEMAENPDNTTAKTLRDRKISAMKRTLKFLKGTDFTAALDLIKETFPGRQHELTGIYNF
jgi:hypothetical protein